MKHLHFSFVFLIVISTQICTSDAQQEKVNGDEWFRLWSGYKEETRVEDALVLFETEKSKKFSQIKHSDASAEDVFAAMLQFASINPQSRFNDAIIKAIKSRRIPKGSLLYFSLDDEDFKVKNTSFTINYFNIDLYLGLDLDGTTLSVGGKWKKIRIKQIPFAVK